MSTIVQRTTPDRTTGLRPWVALVMLWACAAALPAAPIEVRIAYLGNADSDGWRGAAQGTDEANTQGRFLNLHYDLVNVDSAQAALELGAVAIVADVSPTRLREATEAAPGIPVFNVSARDDQLRIACAPDIFHTIPSDAMYRDAVQQWLRKHPASAAVAQAWHPDFVKYAAAQLNKRYRATFAQPMSDTAWAAWAAVKLLSDSVARVGASDAGVLRKTLRNDLAFDGQKGIDMSFRPTGQLRQPMLLVEGGEIVGEAPVRGVAGADDLDSLGLADCLK